MVVVLEPCATTRQLVGHVTDSNVFSRDMTQASHPCLRSLRCRWLLLTSQRAPLQNGDTPLHFAAYGGHEGAIGVLLEAGADREAKDNVSGDREGECGDGSGEGGGQEETKLEGRGLALAR